MAKLKVGLVFTDGGLTYKVIRQAEDGSFISKLIDPSEAKAEKEEVEEKEPEKPKSTRKTTKK